MANRLLLVALFTSSLACATRLTDFTVISTKNTSLGLQKGKRVTGEDCGVFDVNLKQAIDNAIQSADDTRGDMLIDGVVTHHEYFLWECYTVEGNIAVSADGRHASYIRPDGRFQIAVSH